MPLVPLRVLQLGHMPAAAYCTRLLADFGADVLILEPPDGTAERRAAPRVDIGADIHESTQFAHLNFGKRSAPLEDAPIAQLLADADICISSWPDAAWRNAGIDRATLHSAYPDLVFVDVSWFGRSGPYKDFAATDAVCRALAGLVHLVGPAEGPPLTAPDNHAAIIGGLSACIAGLSGLYARLDGDRGRCFEASVHEACIAPSEYHTTEPTMAFPRAGIGRFPPAFPIGVYPASNGWIGVTTVTPAQWQTFCRVLGLHDLADDKTLLLGVDRSKRNAELEDRFIAKLREKSWQTLFALGLEHRLPIVPVPSMGDILNDASLRERGAIVPIATGQKTLRGIGSPLNLGATPPRRGGIVPRAASSRAAFAKRTQDWSAPGKAAQRRELPLAGVRIIDLSMGWAGPLATRHMADLGADVIKVESCQYADWWRGFDMRPEALAERRYEKAGRFNMMNRNKRAITLDLTSDEGAKLLRNLVKTADAVVENYSVEVLPKLGLDYTALRRVNPSLVMLSMSSFGNTSPWRTCRAYGSTLEQGSGLPLLVGEEDDPPVMSHMAYGDAIGGLNGATALLVALLHRKRTGVGQHIDISQIECMMPLTAPWMLEHAATGRVSPRRGNRHPDYAPQNCFRCAGDDAWVFLSVTDDTAWHDLCRTIERPDLADDPALATAAGRQRHSARIEVAISAWTRTRTPDDAMQTLQQAGIAAGAVRNPTLLDQDPHLLARDFWQTVDRVFSGPQPMPMLPFREHGVPYKVRWTAATLGQFNDNVLSDVLGLDAETRNRLADAQVIGTTLIPPGTSKTTKKETPDAQQKTARPQPATA